ncbi:MAG: PilN domain-containing protein [Pseudomonadales bacterium]
MANINLLPWREERRQALKKEFLVILGGIAILACALVMLVDTLVSGGVSGQQGRNNYLQGKIDELSLQVTEITELEKKKQELLDRMKVIQELQGNRPIIVRIFDELVRTLPDGVFYNALNRTENTVTITGIAESNNRISSLMRNLDKSEWFANPNLTSVKADPDFGEQASEFSLSFSISTPSISEKEG